MIILDTNVISETMRAAPAGDVVAWLQRQPSAEVFVTAITVAEILAGLAVLPDGRRRSGLLAGAKRVFGREFAQRVLPFDEAAAEAYADIVRMQTRAGAPIKELDAQIAGIAQVHRMKIATRNVRDFTGCGVEIVNPWTA